MKKGLNILLVEDDTVEIEAIQKEFKRSDIANPVYVAKDGLNALEVLRNQKIPKPYLVVLDLNLPRMNGLEFLKVMREDSKLKRTIVFVLTRSSDDSDKELAYEYNVSGYIKKEYVSRDFLKIVMMCDKYWKIIEFPG